MTSKRSTPPPLPTNPMSAGKPAQSILSSSNPNKRKQRGFGSTILSGALGTPTDTSQKSILGG